MGKLISFVLIRAYPRHPRSTLFVLRSDAYHVVVRFGPLTGMIERLLVVVLAFKGQYEAIAVTLAAKGLIIEAMGYKFGVRSHARSGADSFGETKSDSPAEADQTSPDELDRRLVRKETYLLGSLLSFTLAVIVGSILRDIAPAAGP